MTANFEKLRSYFNCLAELEASTNSKSGNAMRDAESLRELLKKNALLLGLELNKNKSI